MGYALTLQRLKRRKEFVELVNRYDGLFPELVAPDYPGRYPAPAARVRSGRANAHDARSRCRRRVTHGAVLRRRSASSVSRQEQQAALLRRLNRKEFPIAVTPENTLRFTATGSGRRPLTAGGWLREPYTGSLSAGRAPRSRRRADAVRALRFHAASRDGTESRPPTWPPAPRSCRRRARCGHADPRVLGGTATGRAAVTTPSKASLMLKTITLASYRGLARDPGRMRWWRSSQRLAAMREITTGSVRYEGDTHVSTTEVRLRALSARREPFRKCAS